MSYPKKHFPGTPQFVKWAVADAIDECGVNADKWTVPLEAIARYESDCNPDIEGADGLRGMMQQSVGQYAAAIEAGFIYRARYHDATQAVVVAIRYIQGKLPGYGGYGGITKLLERTDRGPGDVLRAWQQAPASSYSALRRFYHGY